ncbi:MAG: hypothetical protein M1832_000605 [Thelocarpon impressellum]|nr:MAG: hypothetical protein M1832_000605 [Thelocarpon impressellum]
MARTKKSMDPPAPPATKATNGKTTAAAAKVTKTSKAAPKKTAAKAAPKPAPKTATKSAANEPEARAKVAPKTRTKAAPKTAIKASPETSPRSAIVADASATTRNGTRKVTKSTKQDDDSTSEADDKAEDEASMADPPTTNGFHPAEASESTSTGSGKRKRGGDETPEPATAAPKAAKKARVTKARAAINAPPTQRLDVYVFGEGSAGELGLGTAKIATDVKRPRLNPLLAAATVGVVQVAVGGMHVAALTHDNRILTWGVNDQGALGRDTAWDGGLVDIADDASDDSSDEKDSGLNPRESTPTAIRSDAFPDGTVFTQLAAGDSSTFAVTADGSVYGWGTFRNNEGILGFTKDVSVQTRPMLMPELKKIRSMTMGSNHALALDDKGNVWAWGSGQQNQLGRRIIERTRTNGLLPRELGVRRTKFTAVACGAFHSFAIDRTNRVWAWGLNNYCETGIVDGAGNTDAVVLVPTVVEALRQHKVASVAGGGHHSAAVTTEGDCLVWGRVDGFQTGIRVDDLPEEDVVFDDRNKPRILTKPAKVPGLKVRMVSASTDTCLAIGTDGKAYSWGFSANYQTGQGTDDDIEVATPIDNTAVRGKKLDWAGAGGQFGVLTAPAGATAMTNGI